MVYYCLCFELYIYGAPKSFKCLGPIWVLTRPWVAALYVITEVVVLVVAVTVVTVVVVILAVVVVVW